MSARVVVSQQGNSSNIFNSTNSTTPTSTATKTTVAPTAVPTTSFGPTIQTTVSMIPSSSTLPPTYSDPCYVCGTGDNAVVNASQMVTIQLDGEDAAVLSCGDLEIGGSFRFVSPAICPLVQSAGCNCTRPFTYTTDSPTISPAPSQVQTYTPTLTPVPSGTEWPTGSIPCNLCGINRNGTTIGKMLTDWSKKETLSVDGLLYTCEELHRDAVGRFIPPQRCVEIQQRIIIVAEAIKNTYDESSNIRSGTEESSGISPLESGCTCIYDDNESDVDDDSDGTDREPSAPSPTTSTTTTTGNDPTSTSGASSTKTYYYYLSSSLMLAVLMLFVQ